MTSTVQRGNGFRDVVVSMLEAAGFRAESEVRRGFKKADAAWRREDVDGSQTFLVEAKDYSGSLPRRECQEFATEYGQLVRDGQADRAWLVSRGDIVPDGRALVDAQHGCKAMTFAEFQRRLFGIDAYLSQLVASYEAERTGDWYVPPHTTEGIDLEAHVRGWMDRSDALPLAVVAGYGKGKSTFALHLAATLAREALQDQSRRLPVLVPLGNIVDEQSLEGLLGKVFTARHASWGYNFGLFERLNRAGRFVVIFDGFDEMKHGMTLPRFEGNIVELMRLDRGDAKLMILGRDTAIDDDVEFRSIILGRQRTAGGSEVAAGNRRAFDPVYLREFTLEEARSFVTRYFPLAVAEAHRGRPDAPDERWVTGRQKELLGGSFDQLLARPVHARMLCQIATDTALVLADLSTHGLFDRFVHFLIDREIRKRGRDQRFTLEVRRRFNGELALWLWRQGAVSTVSLAAVPNAVCREATTGVQHDYDDVALRKELTAGCLIEKAGGTIYFGHRSIQEFLVSETLLRHLPVQATAGDVLGLVSSEVGAFLVDAARSSADYAARATVWLASMAGIRRTDVPPAAIRVFVELVASGTINCPPASADPWFMWIRYFVLNSGLEYAPRTKAALAEIPRLLAQANTAEGRAAAVVLGARALRQPSASRHEVGVKWLAGIMDPLAIRQTVERARSCRHDEFAYVTRSKHPELWALVQSGVPRNGGEGMVRVDLDALALRSSTLARTGIAEDVQRLGIGEDHRALVVPLQALYRAWGLREAELERIRPFFNDAQVRTKVRPLEVEVPTARSERPRDSRASLPSATSDPREPKPTLSLKRPAGWQPVKGK